MLKTSRTRSKYWVLEAANLPLIIPMSLSLDMVLSDFLIYFNELNTYIMTEQQIIDFVSDNATKHNTHTLMNDIVKVEYNCFALPNMHMLDVYDSTDDWDIIQVLECDGKLEII